MISSPVLLLRSGYCMLLSWYQSSISFGRSWLHDLTVRTQLLDLDMAPLSRSRVQVVLMRGGAASQPYRCNKTL